MSEPERVLSLPEALSSDRAVLALAVQSLGLIACLGAMR